MTNTKNSGKNRVYPSSSLMEQSFPMSEVAFINAFETYADAIFRHCTLRTGDRELGKDLMQETFMKTWICITEGTVIENTRAFLYKIANNLIIDHFRRKRRRKEDSLEEMGDHGHELPHSDTLPPEALEQQRIIETIERIEEPYRTAVVMRYIDDLQPREIAEALDISPNVVSVRIARGMKKIQIILGIDE